MIVKLIVAGCWRLYAVCNARGDCELEDFLQPEEGDRLSQDKVNLMSELDRIAHSFDQQHQTEKTHIVDRGERIWQTTQGRLRVLWFYEPSRIMIFSHGFIKSTQKTPDRELEKARKNRRAYRTARANGNVHFVARERGDA